MKAINGFAGLLVGMLLATAANAADDMLKLPIEAAMNQPEAKQKLSGDVKFYWGDESHPAVAESFGTRVTNKKTNAFNKSDEEACNWVWLSAMIQLKETAQRLGADGVINIESFYDKNSFRSRTQFECAAGSLMAGVALRGEFVKFK